MPLLHLPAVPDLVERVYRALFDAVCDGTLAPRARLTQEDVAAQLAVSRQPVLQAFRLLKQDGLVLDAPGRGICVAPLAAESIAPLYQVRGALDALAAQLAAERHQRIDPKLIERGREAARAKDVRAMIDADIDFHKAIYAASGNALIEPSARAHWVHLRRVMGAVLQSERQREKVWDEHAAIAQAIADGDAARAVACVARHSRQASSKLTARIQRKLKRDTT
jgi:DNA-binding GntR family transcriptional regulator